MQIDKIKQTFRGPTRLPARSPNAEERGGLLLRIGVPDVK
jgi:hypothetical protein